MVFFSSLFLSLLLSFFFLFFFVLPDVNLLLFISCTNISIFMYLSMLFLFIFWVGKENIYPGVVNHVVLYMQTGGSPLLPVK